jgi:hypothetical protein
MNKNKRKRQEGSKKENRTSGVAAGRKLRERERDPHNGT